MLTVLMATHDGSDTLERTLRAFAALDEPSGGWKLVIVNNASTDGRGCRSTAWTRIGPASRLR